MLKAIRFRVQNFRNIDDSDWIPVERVTVFVGRNESGKTALLKALHKFNPATPEPYNPQREFPRDRYTRDFENGEDWPVCSVAFEFSESLRNEIQQLLGSDTLPREVICTRYYDGSLDIAFEPDIESTPVEPNEVIGALDEFASASRRIDAPEPDEEEQIQELRTRLANWASDWKEQLSPYSDLRNEDGVSLLTKLRQESEQHSSPHTADIIEALHEAIDPVISEAKEDSPEEKIIKLIEQRLPVFVYFENFGILSSAIYLPRFLEDLQNAPNDPSVRTINAMFKHVRLTADEIQELGREQAPNAGQPLSSEVIEQDQQRKEARAIKLNSASIDITNRFNNWYGQRRHTIDYDADGDYFRIWVSDDRRPNVKIELESRSKGFQWFFSFYLLFLVESEEGHKDAILLLDEPGLHLHPTAQQELIVFFEKLSDRNQLLYTTHSPFLVDGKHIHRVRPVTEDETGHSRVNIEGWPRDRETIFPLQAAAGYAMVRGLFQHRKTVLVEGMSDYYYLHALSQQCQSTERACLPDDIYITPCGGTKHVGHIASLFLGQEVRPVVLLDGDDAGQARRDALMRELYSGHENSVLMLDGALNREGESVEIEDILGEDIFVQAVKSKFGGSLRLNADDRTTGSLPKQIKSAAERHSIELPAGWKASVAIQLVSEWAEKKTVLPETVLDAAGGVFKAILERFEE